MGTWVCGGTVYYMTLGVTLHDAAGLSSNTEQYTLECDQPPRSLDDRSPEQATIFQW